jgi:hypothetical protein
VVLAHNQGPTAQTVKQKWQRISENVVESRDMNCLPMEPVNLSNAKIVSPQGIQLNGSGPAIFREQSSCFSVQVPIGLLKNWKERKHADTVQVWLLRADGTQVPQCTEPFVFSVRTFGEHAKDYKLYTFPKVPEDELASVIVSYNGRLYCHEITKTRES